MSHSVDQAFVKQYESEVHHEFQRRGTMLLNTVRWKKGIAGSSTTFQKVGQGKATTKARHGVITPMNQDHTPIECAVEDFYAGDWSDKLDEAKSNHDERQVIALGGVLALGRKADEQVITKMDETTQPAVSWTVSSSAAVRNSLLEMVEALCANDVDNDGQITGLLTPRAWAMAMTVEEFSSADYVGANGLPFRDGAPMFGRFKDWMKVKWAMHTGLPGQGSNAAKLFLYHKTAVGYASTKAAGNIDGRNSVHADITWHGDRASYFVNHMMSGGACLIDDRGVIEASVDDTAALPTS
jgi:hypothetical protein